MVARLFRFLRAMAVPLLLGLVLPLASQAQAPLPAHAAVTVTGTPVAICGSISNFVPATAGTAGVLAFSTVSVNASYPIAAGVTVSGATGVATGSNVCLVGVINAAGQLISASLTPNADAPLTVCGTVSAYTPATASTLGSLTVGTTVVTLGLGTTFSGTAVTTGANLCFALTVNALGLATTGTVSANSGSTASSTPTQLCGTVSSYLAPTASATGSLTLSNVNTNSTYTIASGVTVAGATGIATGANVCLIGATNAAGQLISATLIPNTTTQVTSCGVVSAYSAATASADGSITIGGVTVPLSVGTTFTGGTITTGANLCITFSVNALGRASSGTVATPLSAIPVTSGSTRLHHPSLVRMTLSTTFAHTAAVAQATGTAHLYWTNSGVRITFVADGLPAASTLGKHAYVLFAHTATTTTRVGSLAAQGMTSRISGRVASTSISRLYLYAERSATASAPGKGLLIMSAKVH